MRSAAAMSGHAMPLKSGQPHDPSDPSTAPTKAADATTAKPHFTAHGQVSLLQHDLLPRSCRRTGVSSSTAAVLTVSRILASCRCGLTVTSKSQAKASAQQMKTPVHGGVSRAVVVGGSVAGILAAAVAAPFFDEVRLACYNCVLCYQAYVTTGGGSRATSVRCCNARVPVLRTLPQHKLLMSCVCR